MKVLFLTGSYPDNDDCFSGIFIHNQAKAIRKKGNEVAVLAFDMRSIRKKRKWGFSKYVFDGIQVYRYSIPCGPIPYVLEFLSKISAEFGFREVIKVFGKPDLIHAHFLDAGVVGIEIKKRYIIPLVLTEHGSGILRENRTKKTEKICKYVYHNVDSLIAVSFSLKESMLDLVNNKEILVIANILPDFFRYNMIKKYDRFTFLSIGNLIEGKRFDLTLKSFSKLYLETNQIQLKIIGKGKLDKQLKKLAKELGISKNVKFIKEVDNNKLPEVYNKCHCFVLPSNFETFGVVYAEAAACGLPIIATDCGGPKDIVNDINGLIISRDNEEVLYIAMKNIYENYDFYNLEIISEDTIKKFGEKMVSEKINIIYKGIICGEKK